MNLPNKLSMLRIFLVPIMAILFIIDIPYNALWAVIVFICAAVTDVLDGHIARKYDMVTNLGKLLDPIADKLLVLFGLFLIVEANILPIGIGSIVAGLIIGREFLISAVRQVAAANGTVIHANNYGKAKTITQDLAIPMLMLFKLQAEIASLSEILWEIFKYTAYVMFAISVVLTVLSGVIYLIQNKRVYIDEK